MFAGLKLTIVCPDNDQIVLHITFSQNEGAVWTPFHQGQVQLSGKQVFFQHVRVAYFNMELYPGVLFLKYADIGRQKVRTDCDTGANPQTSGKGGA